MPSNTELVESQRRHAAVKMFRAGHSAPVIAATFHRSRRWVYAWVVYQRQHPHTRFRSRSRAQHHPNQVSRRVMYRIVQIRQSLVYQRKAHLLLHKPKRSTQ